MASLSVTWFSLPLARPRLGAAAWLALASFATLTQGLMVPGLLPALADGLGASVAEAGQATSVFALAAALGALPIARAAVGLPGRTVVLAGLAGLGVVNLLAALAQSLAALLLLRAVAGLLAAVVLPAAPALAASLVRPAVRVRALAAVSLGATLAFALGLPAATLAGAAGGWRAAFVLAGLLCAAAALALALRLPTGAPEVPETTDRLAVLRTGAVPATLLLVLLAFAAVFATQGFLGPIAAVTLDSSPALLQAMIALGAVAGVPAGVAIAGRHPREAPAIIAAGLLAAALWQWGLLAGELRSPLLQCAQVAFASAALFAVSPVLQARLVTAAPQARRLVLAANFVAVSLGQATGTALGGLALDVGGLAGAACIGVLAAGLMLAIAARPDRRDQGRTACVS